MRPRQRHDEAANTDDWHGWARPRPRPRLPDEEVRRQHHGMDGKSRMPSRGRWPGRVVPGLFGQLWEIAVDQQSADILIVR